MKKLISLACTFIQYLFKRYLCIQSNITRERVFPNEKTLYFIWNIKTNNKTINSILDENCNMSWYTTNLDAQKACVKYLIKNYL